MTLPRRHPPYRVRRLRPKGMALYISVVATTMIVSALALTAMAVVRLERKQALAVRDRQLARSLARSAVEIGLKSMASDVAWRSTRTNGVATTPQAVGVASAGTLSWSVDDADSSLTNSDQQLRIKGIGRVGQAVQVSSVEVTTGSVGPTELRSLTTGNSSQQQLKNNKWWGQYFRPTLPAEANSWTVSRVDIYVRQANANRPYRARLYRPLANRLPSTDVVDSVDLNSNSHLPLLFVWASISFSGGAEMEVGEGLCFTLESSSSQAALDVGSLTGVSQSYSSLLRGTPEWSSREDDEALRYRVYGYYSSSSNVTPVTGTWIWDSP